jgi:hypothetical protein
MIDSVNTKYLDILCACYEDIASAYPAQYSTEHTQDIALIKRRFECEGMVFLTKTLPSLAKALDKALATGTSLQITSFARKKGSQLPKFLGWLIGMVFSVDGNELADADPFALWRLRQLLYLFYKLEMPYSLDSVQRVLSEFKSTDAGLERGWQASEPTHKSEIKYAADLVARVLGGVCPRNIIPKHGPGSVATSEKSWQKPYFRRDYVEATALYPLDAFYYMNANHLAECITTQGLMARDSDGKLLPWETMTTSTAKVVLVPKDSRGPRLISMEPLEIQWLQQGQLEVLVSTMETNWLTRGHVNFSDQSINRYLAWRGSADVTWKSDQPVENDCLRFMGGNYRTSKELEATLKRVPTWADLPGNDRNVDADLVTLDMKEASDRVALYHLYYLFPSNWVEALLATRSAQTMLPDGEIVALNKFAPMGSAVCFPVEALVFWAIALSAIYHRTPMPLRELRKRVWVYGDDIVCYREDYPVVQQSLERSGLLLNSNKCCVSGSFRESCGMDVYKGADVTPLRIKQVLPESSTWTPQALMAYVAFSNAAYDRGLTNLATKVENLVAADVPVPYTTEDRGSVQFVRSYSDVRTLNARRGIRCRFNRLTHVYEAYGPTPRAVLSQNHNVTYETYLTRWVSKNRGLGITPPDRGHSLPMSAALEADEYSLPRRVSSKRGWKQISL